MVRLFQNLSNLNLIASNNGGKLESFTSEYGGKWKASALTDGNTENDYYLKDIFMKVFPNAFLYCTNNFLYEETNVIEDMKNYDIICCFFYWVTICFFWICGVHLFLHFFSFN